MANDGEHSQNYAATFSKAMDLYVGNGKRFSVEAIADVTGLSANTIYDAKRFGKVSFGTAMMILAVLPAGFANMILADTGLSGAARPDDGDHKDGAKLHTVICQLSHSLAKKREDGRIDHVEDAQLRPEVARLIEVCGGYLASAPALRAVDAAE